MKLLPLHQTSLKFLDHNIISLDNYVNSDLYATLIDCSAYNIKTLSKEDSSLEQASIICKLCNAKFDNLGDMQRHTLTEHMQKGDYQIPLKRNGTSYMK